MAEDHWGRARHDLYSPAGEAPIDPVVWEHSLRVARLTEVIVAVPELANRVVDHAALTAAALYHDAGWVLQLRAGQLTAGELLCRRTCDHQRELAADWIVDRLKGILSPGGLKLAARIILGCNDRDTHLLEAQILAEAENLDEGGLQALWHMVRRQIAAGLSLADMLQAWRRQEQYHYWPAWIKECFRFPSVRTLAEQRLQVMSRFMAELKVACEPGIPCEGDPKGS